MFGKGSNQQTQVQTPGAIALTIVGILIVGATLFGIFRGSRWAFSKIATTDTPNKSTSQTTDQPTKEGVTITSSTNTTTSSAPAAPAPATSPTSTSVTPSNTNSLPQTGSGNYGLMFVGLMVIAYMTSRIYLVRK